MEKLYLVGPFDGAVPDEFRKRLSNEIQVESITSQDEYDRLQEADYIVLRTLQIREKDFRFLQKVKLIQRWGVGYDSVDVKKARKCGIPVAITAGANATPVAEMTVLLILSVYRQLILLHTGIMEKRWEREKVIPVSHTIAGKKAGILGMGAIGKKVSGLLKAFGAEVYYNDVNPLSKEQEQELGVSFASTEDIVSNCEIVSIHTPLTEDTYHMFNAKMLSRMRKDAVLINCARDEIVDSVSLAAALREGRILGAGIDANEKSILDDNPYKGLENVVLTPHIGGNTVDNVDRMIDHCVRNIETIRSGGELRRPDLVN